MKYNIKRKNLYRQTYQEPAEDLIWIEWIDPILEVEENCTISELIKVKDLDECKFQVNLGRGSLSWSGVVGNEEYKFKAGDIITFDEEYRGEAVV